MNALKSMSLDINDYADIVALLCRDMPAGANVVRHFSFVQLDLFFFLAKGR